MKRLTVRYRRAPDDEPVVGTLAEHDHRVYFEYDPGFLETRLEPSPYHLPARAGLTQHRDTAFGPLPGLFDDSLPDGWGRLLIDRHFRRQRTDPATLTPLDRLAYLGQRTMGALTYHPATGPDADTDTARTLDLAALGRNAHDVIQGDAADILPQLLRAGGSPGGARPKVLVGAHAPGNDHVISGEHDLPADFLAAGGRHWIIKFAARADDRDAGPVEYAYSLMARAAGLSPPPTRLFETRQGKTTRHHFGVQRFDRPGGNRRQHIHTYANLVHADFRLPATDYSDLFKVTRALTRNHRDLLDLFRQMAFNIAAHNRDDHAKNFAYLLDAPGAAGGDPGAAGGDWSLTPAYDLTFSHGPGGEHTTTVLGEGKQPTRDHCLRLAKLQQLKPHAARAILDEVNAAVARWPHFADQAGCSAKATRAVGQAIRPLG